ncbi:hypothetical protein PENNAL_c0001G07099 [Penicillium nalgiovense]|uniref:Uncharacterized protein n=1 Tax=Penicillium nalgiovense TaxID=60175 RepID=A0A1V6Z9F0_PENNA|nr:hypothetical protein PENNAL_c0001G07099 [Penicillium nalgiovense]
MAMTAASGWKGKP